MKRLSTILALLFLLQLCFAASISQNEAQTLGTAVFTHLSGATPQFSSCAAYSGSYSTGDTDFYILRFQPTGFVLVASDERSIPILAYSLENEFPVAAIPAHVAWYLDNFSRCMQEIRENSQWAIDQTWGQLRERNYSQYSINRDVAPLLSTTWDQGYPYNYLCPQDSEGPGGRVWAGCTATAMAQVMKKWNYPTTGNGSHSYYASGYGTQSANFGATTYNWANMPNSISTVNNSIATLLYHCGVATDMQYSPEGSGAYSSDARNALVNNFRFNSSAQLKQASNYSSTVWANMIRTDLDLGRPIFYAGYTEDSGHAFVLDGYQGTSSFHFNWGWSGQYNGYFNLGNLNPGSHSFNLYQEAIFDVYPLSQANLVGTVSSNATGLGGATVSIAGTGYSASTNAGGYYSISGVPAGNYQVTASKVGYTSHTQSVTLANAQTTTLNFSLNPSSTNPPPTNLSATVNGNDVQLNWTAPDDDPPPPQGFTDGFESYTDFSLAFAPWTLVDVDGSTTYGMTGFTWPNAYAAMAYMIFNQSATVPPMTDAAAHSGAKMTASIAATPAPNNDWMMSPLVAVQSGFYLRFWAKSYTASYGLERFKVGVSTGGTAPANFSIISGTSYIQAPVEWTQYSYDLSAYAGQQIRIGIQCLSDDAFIFFVDDVSIGNAPARFSAPVASTNTVGTAQRNIGTPIPGPNMAMDTRSLLGYKVYRNGSLISTIGTTSTTYNDMDLATGAYSYSVTAYYTNGESDPAGPVNATISNLTPPQNLSAAVNANDVTLQWTSPVPPVQGEWITWSDNASVGNSVGTNDVAQFDVAHMYDSTDLAAYQGQYLSQVKFVPAYQDCIYTVKIWTGGTASSPGTMVYSGVAQNVIAGDWNLHVLPSPVAIPSTRLWIGYGVDTQGGFPAGCDDGPVVEGKGNMMNFGGWTTLTQLASTLTYNWQIQGFVGTNNTLKAVQPKAIVEIPHRYTSGTLAMNRFEPVRNNRALVGYRVYRNGALIGSISNPELTNFTDMDRPNGTYIYGVTAYYSAGESAATTVTVTVNYQLAPVVFGDGFESYQDFALTFAPWTVIDQDGSITYSFSGTTFPNSEAAMAYIIFNPSQTTPPITDIVAHSGSKMAATFAAVTPINSDWMVSPRITLGEDSILKFYAKSHTAAYGLERFRVGISTATTILPQMFTYISGTEYIQAPTNWTEYFYDLSAYDNQQVYVAIRCVSDDAFVFFVDDFSVHSESGGVETDPFGPPVVLPTSMSVVARVTINAQPATAGDVLAAYVNVGGSPQLRGKQTVQLNDGIAGCILQVYTETNGELVSFKLWKSSTDEVLDCSTTLNTTVNATIGEWPNNLFVINASSGTSQNINLTGGWNLISLNVSPSDHSLATLMAPISTQVQQVKGTEGVYIPGNPYSTLLSLTDGKAYNIQMSGSATWSITGNQIPANTPISLINGWNMAAYLPQASMNVGTAVQSISTWLQQVKGADGVYIPNNPYSTLSNMYPGKGYWIKINGAHQLVYPSRAAMASLSGKTKLSPAKLPEIKLLPQSMTLLARCDWATAGDILLAKMADELRGAAELVDLEGFPAALMQIYCEDSAEEISLWIMKPDGSLLPVANSLQSLPNASLGTYPEFIQLEAIADGDESPAMQNALLGCYPNPFNPSTTISFNVASDDTPVSLCIYNMRGQRVARIAEGKYSAGNHTLVWNGTDHNKRLQGSGVYIIELKAGSYRKTVKAVLTK